MGAKQSLGISGATTLLVGVFTPVVNVPFLGSMSYFQNGKGDGAIILLLAALSLILVLIRNFKGLWFTGFASMAVMAFTWVRFQKKIGDFKSSLPEGLFRGLADMAVQSVHFQWGCALLLVGAVLVVASAAVKEEPHQTSSH